MQVYDFMRTSVRTVAIKALRPATAAEIERMHGDCAICWCEMTVAPGNSGRHSSSCSNSAAARSAAGTAAAADDAKGVAGPDSTAAGAALQHHTDLAAEAAAVLDPGSAGHNLAGSTAAAAVLEQDAGQESGDEVAGADAAGVAQLQQSSSAVLYGYTLPCSHAYHQQCLNQVSPATGRLRRTTHKLHSFVFVRRVVFVCRMPQPFNMAVVFMMVLQLVVQPGLQRLSSFTLQCACE
jgi:hypothetical protein